MTYFDFYNDNKFRKAMITIDRNKYELKFSHDNYFNIIGWRLVLVDEASKIVMTSKESTSKDLLKFAKRNRKIDDIYISNIFCITIQFLILINAIVCVFLPKELKSYSLSFSFAGLVVCTICVIISWRISYIISRILKEYYRRLNEDD